MNEQTRLVLTAYRPDGQDATDPAFTEAIEQAQRDPALAEWFKDSTVFDRQIADRLRTVPVPADLRALILAGAKLSRPIQWWKRRRFWSVAAMFLAMIAIALCWPRQTKELAAWQTHALDILSQVKSGNDQLDMEHDDSTQLTQWLRTQAAPAPAALPPALAGKRTYGCKTLNWNGRSISLMCFDLGKDRMVHLFTTPRRGLFRAPPERRPVFSTYGAWNIASWSEGKHVHMLVTDGDVRGLSIVQQKSVPKAASWKVASLEENAETVSQP